MKSHRIKESTIGFIQYNAYNISMISLQTIIRENKSISYFSLRRVTVLTGYFTYLWRVGCRLKANNSDQIVRRARGDNAFNNRVLFQD